MTYTIYKGMMTMTNIKPVSDLRNYTEVLNEVAEGSPVYLTRNGRGEYAIVKLEEFDKLKAAVKLLTKLEAGERLAREQGWLSSDDVEAHLGL
jgi:prevent-host-death family protein